MIKKITPETVLAHIQDQRSPFTVLEREVKADDVQFWAYAELKAFPELARLARMAMECLDDDLEERPMRHEIGGLHRRIERLLEAMESPPEFRKWEAWYDEQEAKAST